MFDIQVTSIIAPFFKENKMEESANKIIQLSVKEWLKVWNYLRKKYLEINSCFFNKQKKKEGDSVDDITCVLAFFSGFKEIQHK